MHAIIHLHSSTMRSLRAQSSQMKGKVSTKQLILNVQQSDVQTNQKPNSYKTTKTFSM